jgi:hypothetical protein
LIQLAEDEMLEREQAEVPIQSHNGANLIADLRRLRERILARRGGALIDVSEAVQRVREERDDELAGLR